MKKLRNFKGFNWIGFFTLYLKEVRRFFNVFAQTILAPAVTTLLFYIIFTLSLDRNFLITGNFNYSECSGHGGPPEAGRQLEEECAGDAAL